MSLRYRIVGVFATRWYATQYDAWLAYRKGSHRRKLCDPGYMIGSESGDVDEGSPGRSQYAAGFRLGHGWIKVEPNS